MSAVLTFPNLFCFVLKENIKAIEENSSGDSVAQEMV